jgi:hypothetical protein
MVRILSWWVVQFSLALFGASVSQAASIEVMEYACARQIVDRQPVNIVSCKSFRLPSPAYVWVRLKGDATALADLEAGRPIIIRHKWLRFAGPNPDVDTVTADEDLSAGQIDPSYFARLRQEVQARGYFDWRTWTQKERLRSTAYTVEILDQSLQPIPCSPGAAQADCSVSVIVGR